MGIRERFMDVGIPYDDIDREMVEIIDVLNFELGMKTEFCCYGHSDEENVDIVFDKCVTDDQILGLAEYLSKSKIETVVGGIYIFNDFGEFNKWVRNGDERLEIKMI